MRVSSSAFKPETHTFNRGFNLKEGQDILSPYPSRIRPFLYVVQEGLSLLDKFSRVSLNFQRNSRLYIENYILLTVTLLYEEEDNESEKYYF